MNVVKFVSLSHRLPLPTRKYSWFSFLLGYAVTQMVGALRYKPEGHGFDCPMLPLELFFDMILAAAL
jgi:hypothetical protein